MIKVLLAVAGAGMILLILRVLFGEIGGWLLRTRESDKPLLPAVALAFSSFATKMALILGLFVAITGPMAGCTALTMALSDIP